MGSEHPIGEAILEYAREKNIELVEASDFQAIPGKGAKATTGGKEVVVVSPQYLKENELFDDQYSQLLESGETAAFIIIDNEVSGLMLLEDRTKPESKETVEKLHDLNIEVRMLTGDNEIVARKISQELGIKDYYAQVLPGDKAKIIKEIAEISSVAMVGDGINDAPALASADIGIAIGAGTQVAIETADIILTKSNPSDVVKAILLSRETRRKMVQNLFWASGYNVVAIPLAAGAMAWAGVILSPAVGAILMSLSTVVVAVNARLFKSP